MFGLIGLCLNLSGCLYYGHGGVREATTAAAPAPSIDPDYFKTEAWSEPTRLSSRSRDGVSIQKLRFKAHTAFLYLPEPEGGTEIPPDAGRSAVILLPITQGDYYTKQMALYLAASGMIVLRYQSHGHLLTAKNSDDALGEFESLVRGDVADVLSGIDWISAHPRVDPKRIGIAGISMGAIIGSVAAGVDPRIRAGVFILGGGNLAGILFSSSEPSIAAIRKRIEDEEDLTNEALLAEVGRRLRNVDPLTYAGRLDPARILMINAHFDHVIRRRNATALWKAAGEPPLVMLPTGHYTAVFFFKYAQRRMLEHFQKVFGRE